MWIVNILHWIDEETEKAGIPEIEENVNCIRKIIEFATAKALGNPDENQSEIEKLPQCWQINNGSNCNGSILSEIQESEQIYWKCTQCEFEGTVTGWTNLSWNRLKDVRKGWH